MTDKDNEIINCLNDTDGKEHIGIYCADKNGNYTATIKLTDIVDLINRQQAEIERLEDEKKNAYKDIVDTCEIGARNEFAERLKQRMFAEDFLLCEPCDMADIIDNLLKEMECIK